MSYIPPKEWERLLKRVFAIDADGHLQVDIVDPSGLAEKDVPVRTLTIKDIDPTPVGDVLLKVLDQVLRVRDLTDASYKPIEATPVYADEIILDIANKDVKLYRSAANVLATPDDFQPKRLLATSLGGNLTITAYEIYSNIDNQVVFRFDYVFDKIGLCKKIGYEWGAFSRDRLHFFEAPTTSIADFIERLYLDNPAGNLYIDGSYYTFSPELPKTEEELKSLLSGILTKPSAPRKDGKRICKCGMVGGYCDKHYEEMQQLYAKDVGSASLASAQLILMLYNKIEALERRIKALEEGRSTTP